MRKASAVLAAAGLFLALAVPNAGAVSLASLASNPANSISVGDLTFSNFQISFSGTGAFDPANVDVSPTFAMGWPGLVYSPGWLLSDNPTGPSFVGQDLAFSYTVSSPKSYIRIDDAYAFATISVIQPATGNPVDETQAGVAEDILTPDGLFHMGIGASQNGVGVAGTSNFGHVVFPRTTSVTVFKDITETINSITGSGGLRQAHISGLTQVYSHNPEPGSVALLVGMGVSGSLFGLRLRRRA